MRLGKLIPLFFILCTTGLALRAQENSIDSAEVNCITRASSLLEEALTLMQKNYYKNDAVDWKPLIDSARVLLNRSSGCEAAYGVVQWCFDQIKEQHSFIMPPVKAALYSGNINSGGKSSISKPLSGRISHELIDNNIAYINVPWIATTDERLCRAYADSLQALIKLYDGKGVARWVLDLRNNTGGNCWPMLAGLAPLLGNGIYGYFISSKETIPFQYRNGSVFQGKNSRCTVTNPFVLEGGKKNIIVLTGKNTSSAGEIVALSFKGLSNVYIYGQPTAGLTTANATYALSDGSMLVLTVCKEADRNGKIIEGKIQPDVLIQASKPGEGDYALASAIMYLQTL